MRVALVTDSTCDLPDELIQQYQIRVVPSLIVIDGREYQDGIDLSREAFYDLLPKLRTPPTTAANSSGVYAEVYRQALAEGADKVLSIHCSSKLSGIYNAAQLAAQNLEGRVHVLDSGQLSLGVGFQVLAAAETLAAGQSWEQAIAQIYATQGKLRVMAMLDSLEYVRRSGRVSWAKAQIGALLQLRPFIELSQGLVVSRGQSRTRHKGIERLGEMLLALQPLERLAILHTNASQEAQAFWQSLPLSPALAPFIINVTTVIGAHVGPKGLGFAAVVK